MKTDSLKKVTKFWQEITFVVLIGILLVEIVYWTNLGHAMDMWDIFLVCFFLPLLTCLIGQLFWKNKVLGTILSILLGLSSFIFILMSLYFIATTSTKMVQAITMFLLGLIMSTSAITMLIKYLAEQKDHLINK